jgi:hypothetical protein
VQREDCDAEGDAADDEVFVERVAFAEERDVQEHYGQEFAGFGEDEGYVVDVFEAGVAEGGGERGGDCDEEEGEDDLRRGEDGGDFAGVGFGVAGRRGNEVDEAGDGGEGGLDCVEEDGVLEAGIGGAVGGGC